MSMFIMENQASLAMMRNMEHGLMNTGPHRSSQSAGRCTSRDDLSGGSRKTREEGGNGVGTGGMLIQESVARSGSVSEQVKDEPKEEIPRSGSVDPVGRNNPLHYSTDFSDTTETEPDVGEVSCLCLSHDGKEMMNTVIPLPVEQVFSLVFSGSKFFRDLLALRKTYNLMESSWQLCPENGHKMRQVTYTITLNHSMAKNAQTTETQRLLKHSKPGQVYVVVCDVVSTGIPYSDTFSIKSHFCLTKVASNQCRLCVHGNIQYKKSVWGLVKSLIEKSAIQGLQDFCADLEVALNKEANLIDQHTMKKRRRRKRGKTVNFSKVDSLSRLSKSLHTQTYVKKLSSYLSGLECETFRPSSDLITKVILATLFILLLINFLLFYKLWSIEDEFLRAAPANPLTFDVPRGRFEELSIDGWLKLLNRQEKLHQLESERWKEALGKVLKIINIVEISLTDLRSNTDLYKSLLAFNLDSVTQVKGSTTSSERVSTELRSNSEKETTRPHGLREKNFRYYSLAKESSGLENSNTDSQKYCTLNKTKATIPYLLFNEREITCSKPT
ncbi:protein Aster-B-like isoform X2 [Tachypleus tridentatus]|uniref:protein Aster-B-like isoform X2 n=1 Tax=Tachypleus tridentatus TaxID=6853 RepID=UPI003FD4BA80